MVRLISYSLTFKCRGSTAVVLLIWLEKETLAQAFTCEFCAIFKNTFFLEPLWWLFLSRATLKINFKISWKFQENVFGWVHFWENNYIEIKVHFGRFLFQRRSVVQSLASKGIGLFPLLAFMSKLCIEGATRSVL